MFGFLIVYLSVAIGYAIGALAVTTLSGKTPAGGMWALALDCAFWPANLVALFIKGYHNV